MYNENFIKKDWRNIDISFGLVYPNIYKIGMSSYSIRLLYHLINSYDKVVCERIFLPEKIRYPFHPQQLPKEKKLRSIESKVLPQDFDILGFSIQFENDYKNIMWILDSASIPNFKMRQKNLKNADFRYPLIIGGGAAVTSNPIPFSDYFDLFFIGDSEPNLREFFKHFQSYNFNEIDFPEFLKKATQIEGIYVPSLNNKTKRAIQQNLDYIKIPHFQIMSDPLKRSNTFESNFFVEVNRGCPFQCKFCISSFHNSPFRNRSLNKIKTSIDNGIKILDFETISLIGSCVSAHPNFYEICKHIIDKGKRLTVPSLRIEHLTEEIVQILSMGSIKTITLAPESGSEQLRYDLGKMISNDKIFSVLNDLKKSQIKNIKLYFLIGLPNETDKDIEDTINMLKKIDDMRFNSVKVNISPFVPKLNTPFQNKIDFYLKDNFNTFRLKYQKFERELNKIPSLKLKFHNFKQIINNTKLQVLISLGDHQLCNLLREYYELGGNFSALRKAEKNLNFNLEQYFLKIKNEYCPWRI